MGDRPVIQIGNEKARSMFTPATEFLHPRRHAIPDLAGPESFIVNSGKEKKAGATFDAAVASFGFDSKLLKNAFQIRHEVLPEALYSWFAAQTFIGYQACAIVSQQWLISKALSIPAKDAVRNGYDIASDDGEEIDPKVLSALTRADKKYKINENLIEFATNTRRFGYRIALFNVESADEDYYYNPFNLDGVKPGSYKGISQVDPSWVAPILDKQAAANPASMDFYEPTWWQIGGKAYHKSHLVIARYITPPDILKPTYQYGGIPLTQMLIEQVYAAVRTAAEAPMLAMTKRLNVIHADVTAIEANPAGFEEKLKQLIEFRDNYGVYVAGLDDVMEQIETSLSDFDDVVQGQFQLVASVSGVPATRLLETSPKGFNATGEYEQDNYAHLLESVQTDLSLVVERHHELVMRSDIKQKIETFVIWKPVSSPTDKDISEINLAKSQTDLNLQQTGAVDSVDIRNRVIEDPKSGFTGIEALERIDEPEEPDPDMDLSEEGSETADNGILGYVSVSPDIEDGMRLAAWVRDAGITGVVPGHKMHLTLAYSAVGVPEYAPCSARYGLRFTGEVGVLQNALVLCVKSSALTERFEELKAMGAEWPYEGFQAHITIKYDPEPDDFEKARVAYGMGAPGRITVGNEVRQVLK